MTRGRKRRGCGGIALHCNPTVLKLEIQHRRGRHRDQRVLDLDATVCPTWVVRATRSQPTPRLQMSNISQNGDKRGERAE